MRPIRLPEPPSGFSGVPDILDGAIRRALVIGNGFAGAENQCIGLVRSLGLADRHSFQRVTRPRGGINEWLHWIPISLHKKINYVVKSVWGDSRFRTTVESNKVMPLSAEKSGLLNVLEADPKQIAVMARESFEKEGPLLVIASGRDTIPVASTIRKLAPENVFVIQIQHPRSRLDRFDLVITPRHDYYPQTAQAQEQIPWFLQRWITPRDHPDSHVILTVGALHHADSAALRSAAFTWHDELAYLPKPLLVVNIGGPTSNCPYGADLAKELIAKLQDVLWSCGSLRISFSRRTPLNVSEMFLSVFRANSKVHIWDGEGSNPHMGHLAWADAFVVTADSVSMLSEVCSTGKPVYIAGAERCRWKFADFRNSLQERGAVRAFTGKEDISETWSYPPLNDTAESAAQVHEALAKRGWRICT
ncbi:mitochondrial fission protein ELM1-like isoform X1 [Rhodamnia argentea]|uniref:Mitochondrial fission protein ELM1-like isoform X1 n=1 Tax=Rhodamnia argentea TaxID=178133 RepID=A0A8B8PAN8_9MYRT|nr:mitochondrial fission protein ELM1-like isoform X1 [Rhodamnia argentea]